ADLESSARLAIEVDDIEEEDFEPGAKFDVNRIYLYKRESLEMKHAIEPLSAALKSLVEKHKDLIDKQIRSYLRDVNDHQSEVKEHIQSFDERLSSLLDVSVAKVSMQQNTDMRTISAVVGMAAVPTLIAGIYGMNFDNMPELHAEYGYYASIAFMVITVAVIFSWFRKNNWL